MINTAKEAWWYLSDSRYRDRYQKSKARKQKFQQGQKAAMKHIINQSPEKSPTILSGPFTGMKWPAAEHPKSYSAQMLLGTYELEIHPWIEDACNGSYDLIIDLGAAEGFYAVGLAIRNPEIPVIAYEAEKAKHNTIRLTAQANAVSNIQLKGFCCSDELKAATNKNSKVLAIVDVEGAEDILLRPDLIPALKIMDFIVETHDDIVPGITDELTDRFKDTHTINGTDAKPRQLADAPDGTQLPDELMHVAMDEFRGMSQTWLHLKMQELGTPV